MDAILTCSLWTMGSMMVPIEVQIFGRTMGDLTQIVHITVPTPERAQLTKIVNQAYTLIK